MRSLPPSYSQFSWVFLNVTVHAVVRLCETDSERISWLDDCEQEQLREATTGILYTSVLPCVAQRLTDAGQKEWRRGLSL